MNYKYVLQTNMFDCGIAALQTIFLQFGRKIKKEDLIKKPLNQGVTAYNLIKLSKKFGLESVGVKTDLNHLNQDNLPCIAHVIKEKSYFHYIVILKNNKKTKTLVVVDPAYGITKMAYEEFVDISTNIFLVFNKTKIIKEKDLRFKKIVIEIIKTNKKYIIKSLILSFFLLFFSLCFSYYLKITLEYTNMFFKISLIFLIISLVKNIISYLRNKTIITLNKRIDQTISKRFVNNLLTLPNNYYQNNSSNEMISVINDIENFKNIVIKISIFICIDIFVLLFMMLFLSFYNIIYSLILFLVTIISIMLSYKFQFKFNNYYLKMKTSKIKTTSSLIEAIKGHNSIKNLNISGKIIDKLNKNYEDLLNSSYSYSNNSSNYNLLSNLLNEIFFIIIITLALYLKESSVFDIILFGNIYNLFISFLSSITSFISMYPLYTSSVEKILDLFNQDKVKLNNKIVSFKKIIYNDVTFKCDDKTLFNNLNLTITSLSNIFITGKTGLGKTTLFKLLFDDYNYQGKITLDNIDLKYIDKELIKSNITYVSKEEVLFNDTIYNNLKLVNNSDEEIDNVLKICLFDEVLRKRKIDKNYIIYDNGSNLSSGEKAKLIIARALLTNNSIIVFDESFNEIDLITERKILTNIMNYYDNLTIIFISHRRENQDLFKKRYILENKQLKEEK